MSHDTDSVTCIYLLHGFASAPKYPSDKADVIASVFHLPVKQMAYDSAASFTENFSRLQDQVDVKPKFFIGTSLGAFYASKLAEHYDDTFAASPIMLNPCHNPFEILAGALGEQQNFATGESFRFEQHALDSYRDVPFIDFGKNIPRVVLLNMDDELIDATETKRLYERKLKIISFAHGGHRFKNISSDEVVHALKSIDSYAAGW